MDNNAVEIVEFDIRGQICPSTLLVALKEINSYQEQIKSGSVRLHFKTDHRDATVRIPDIVMNMGYTVSVVKEEGYYLILISKGEE